jgi:prepilin-type N-terminal cleavage/methylation domain-containing protein
VNARKKGFTLVELLVVIAILGLLAALIVPTVGYALFTANKGACLNNLANMKKVSEVLHTMLDSPIGDKWIEGKKFQDYPDPEIDTYDLECDDNAQKSRLAFWRMVADPRIKDRVSAGGVSVFICNGNGEANKTSAKLSHEGTDYQDFGGGATGAVEDLVKRQLFYSMFCQESDEPGMVPKYGSRGELVVMGDRSPQDDGYELAGNSANHQWGNENTGQNVCYATGQTKWEGRYDIGIDDDSIYESDAGGAITADTKAGDLDDTILMPVTLGTNANP